MTLTNKRNRNFWSRLVYFEIRCFKRNVYFTHLFIHSISLIMLNTIALNRMIRNIILWFIAEGERRLNKSCHSRTRDKVRKNDFFMLFIHPKFGSILIFKKKHEKNLFLIVFLSMRLMVTIYDAKYLKKTNKTVCPIYLFSLIYFLCKWEEKEWTFRNESFR